MASAHSTLMWQGDCHRGQAWLPQWNGGGRGIYVRRRSLWEPGLPAMASAHSTLMWQGDCHRGQARSHRVVVVDAAFMYGADHCGSQPAGDGVCTFDIDVAGRLPSRASPLPQWNGGGRGIYVRRRSLWEPGLPAMASAHSILMWQGEDSCSHPDALQLMSIVDSRFLLSAHQTTPAPPLTTPPQAWSAPRSPARSPGHAGSGNAHPVRASARRTMPGPR